MSTSNAFYKAAYHTGQGIKAAWYTAIGNTRLEKRGLQTFGAPQQLVLGTPLLAAVLGLLPVLLGSTDLPPNLRALQGLIVGAAIGFFGPLNLVSMYKAGKYDLHQEKAKKAASPDLGNP